MKSVRRPGAMPEWQRWSLFWILGICISSGVAYLLGHEFLIFQKTLANHQLLSVHGMSANAVVFLFGTVALGHIRIGLKLKKNRISGLANLFTLVILILTSWMLYYGAEEIRDLAVLTHWIVGLLFIAILICHIHISIQRDKKRAVL